MTAEGDPQLAQRRATGRQPGILRRQDHGSGAPGEGVESADDGRAEPFARKVHVRGGRGSRPGARPREAPVPAGPRRRRRPLPATRALPSRERASERRRPPGAAGRALRPRTRRCSAVRNPRVRGRRSAAGVAPCALDRRHQCGLLRLGEGAHRSGVLPGSSNLHHPTSRRSRPPCPSRRSTIWSSTLTVWASSGDTVRCSGTSRTMRCTTEGGVGGERRPGCQLVLRRRRRAGRGRGRRWGGAGPTSSCR